MFVMFVLAEQQYIHAEHSGDEFIVRLTPTLRVKFVSYLEVSFQEENFYHARCSS